MELPLQGPFLPPVYSLILVLTDVRLSPKVGLKVKNMYRVKMKIHIMTRSVLYLAVVCFIAGSALSCALYSLRETGPAEKHNVSSPFIWKTTINETDFYLVGSFHMGKKISYPLPEQYLRCYEESNIIVMELEDDSGSLEQGLLEYAKKDRLPEGMHLKNYLSASAIKKIHKVTGRTNFRKYGRYEPWLLKMILEGNQLKLYGFEYRFGIDAFFQKRAFADKKPVMGLERLEDQLRIFDQDLSFEDQLIMLDQYIYFMEKHAAEEAVTASAYFAGDADLFEKSLLSGYDPDNPDKIKNYELLFAERNRKWVEKLEQISEKGKGTCMVIAGAGHFFGPENIRLLLEGRGHRVY